MAAESEVPLYDRNATAFETPLSPNRANSRRFAEVLVAMANILVPFVAMVAVIVGGVYAIRAALKLFFDAPA